MKRAFPACFFMLRSAADSIVAFSCRICYPQGTGPEELFMLKLHLMGRRR